VGQLLCQNGFETWDLGMDMDYKRDLGTHLVARDDFVALIHHAREAHTNVLLPTICQRTNCRSIIDQQTPEPTASAPETEIAVSTVCPQRKKRKEDEVTTRIDATVLEIKKRPDDVSYR
jgi:hypothetical protein